MRVRPLWALPWMRPYKKTLLYLYLILAFLGIGWSAPPPTQAGDPPARNRAAAASFHGPLWCYL
jgi:hypothetical protein